MTAPSRSAAIAPLDQIYPPYGERMAEWRRAAERDGLKAEPIYAAGQEIYKAWHAGAEHMGSRIKGALIELVDEGTVGEFTARRVMRELGVEGA